MIVIFAVLIAFLVLCIQLTREKMRMSGRTLSEEIAYEMTHPNDNEPLIKKTPLTIPYGTRSAKVYTYDGRPIRSMKTKERFEVVIAPETRRMISIYTRKTWSGKNCLLYCGRPIGFLATSDERSRYISQLQKFHRPIVLTARISSYDVQQGYPKVYAQIPDKEWFVEQLRESKKGVAN